MTSLKPVIVIGGLAATGSTTFARKLTTSLDLEYIYAGKIMRELCVELGLCSKEVAFGSGFNEFYKEFGRRLLKDKQFNQKVDERVLQHIKEATIPTAAEGRITAALVTKYNIQVVIKIWIKADIKDRVQRFRIKNPNFVGTDDAIEELLLTRDKLEHNQYLEQYGIDLFKPEEYNDIILDTTGLDLEEAYFKLINNDLFRERIKLLIPFYPNYDVVYRWKCLKCGYLYEGFVPVHICPRCGNIDERLFKDL